RKLLDAKAEAEAAGRPAPPAVEARLAVIIFDEEVGHFEQSLRDYEAKPWEAPGLPPEVRARRRANAFRDLLNDFLQVAPEPRAAAGESARSAKPGRICRLLPWAASTC